MSDWTPEKWDKGAFGAYLAGSDESIKELEAAMGADAGQGDDFKKLTAEVANGDASEEQANPVVDEFQKLRAELNMLNGNRPEENARKLHKAEQAEQDTEFTKLEAEEFTKLKSEADESIGEVPVDKDPLYIPGAVAPSQESDGFTPYGQIPTTVAGNDAHSIKERLRVLMSTEADAEDLDKRKTIRQDLAKTLNRKVKREKLEGHGTKSDAQSSTRLGWIYPCSAVVLLVWGN